VRGDPIGAAVRVQISADGMHWYDKGTTFALTNSEVNLCRVSHFGNWLRLAGELPADAEITALIALALKG